MLVRTIIDTAISFIIIPINDINLTAGVSSKIECTH